MILTHTVLTQNDLDFLKGTSMIQKKILKGFDGLNEVKNSRKDLYLVDDSRLNGIIYKIKDDLTNLPKEIEHLKNKSPKLPEQFISAADDIIQRNLTRVTLEFKKVIEKRTYVIFSGKLS